MNTTKQEVLAASQRAVEIIAKSERSWERPMTKVIRWLFSFLPVETQLHVGIEAFRGMTAAIIVANERFGPRSNVRIDGGDHQVGYLLGNGDFVVLGRGRSWEAAFDDAEHRGEEPAS